MILRETVFEIKTVFKNAENELGYSIFQQCSLEKYRDQETLKCLIFNFNNS